VGQEIAAQHFYRPRAEKIAARYANRFPKLELFTVDQLFGGWQKVQKLHFNDGGVFPHYGTDVITQMDRIGVGSLPIVVLTGFFSGAVMALQMSRALQQYGATGEVGRIVAVSLVRELGPVLTALLVAGRNASGIASELGSMKVTEQIDAMRALGTDPIQKLVTPRLIACAVMLPALTVIADFVGLFGGAMVAGPLLQLVTRTQYWNSAYQSIEYNDIAQGLLKPFSFAIIIALVGCFYGLRTTGGTQGVGRATTQAVVVASVWIFIVDFFITRVFINL
jgi:phospholipid/cholesterol/gamma-HCH transport system permease protein